MDIKLGDFVVVGKHEGCKYDGTLMKCTPQTINGSKYPSTAPDSWVWCNGRDKKRKTRSELELMEIGSGSRQIMRRCGYSTYHEEVKKMQEESDGN